MKRFFSCFLALLFCLLPLTLFACGREEDGGVVDGLTVEPSAVTYTDAEAEDAAARITSLLADAVLSLRGLALTEEMRASVGQTVRTRFLPIAARAGLTGELLSASLSELEGAAPSLEGLFSLYGRLAVLLSAKTAGKLLYGVAELALSLIGESYEALESEIPGYYQADLARVATARAALTERLGQARFSDLLSVFFFTASLLRGGLVSEGDAMLTDGELLRILTHHADYYTALSLTASDFSAFLSVASLFAAEATSDRRTPLSASLSELALSGGFLCFADALASVLPLYGALAQRLTKADIAALRQGDAAPVLARLSACGELDALLSSLDSAAVTPTASDLQRIEGADLTEEYLAFTAQLSTAEELKAALAATDPLAVKSVARGYFASLCPVIIFLSGKENRP